MRLIDSSCCSVSTPARLGIRAENREIGVRMALGADRGDVLRLIFREG